MKTSYKPIFEGVDTSDIDVLFEALEEVRQLLINGYLEEVLNIDQTQSTEVLTKVLGENFDRNRLREKVEIAVQKMAKGGCTLKDAFGFSDEGMEAIYFMGHTMFQRRKYPAAKRVFEFLVKLDNFEPKYYHALASTQHRQKDFFSAARHYMQAHVLSPITNPELHYHSADCYLRMDDLMSAILCLGHCIEACDDRNEIHRQIKTRSVPLREILIKQLQERKTNESKAQSQQAATRAEAKKREREI